MSTRAFRVGDVSFVVRSEDPSALQLLHPAFDPFFTETTGDGAISVELVLGDDAPVLVDGTPLELREEDGALALLGPSSRSTVSLDNRHASYRGPPQGQPVHALLRLLLARALLSRGALLVHASALIDDAGEATLFVGPSGAGKTTVAATLPGVVAADEAVVLAHNDRRTTIAGTPWWNGRAISAPLRELVFLARGDAPTFERVARGRATGCLVSACGPLPERDAAATLHTAASLVEHTPRISAAVLSTREEITAFLAPRLRGAEQTAGV